MIMKKFLNVFVKRRKRKENFDAVSYANKSETLTNSQNTAFKYYKFDSDCCDCWEPAPQKCSTACVPENNAGNLICPSIRSFAPSQDFPPSLISEAEKNYCPSATKLDSISSNDSFTEEVLTEVQKLGLMEKKSKTKRNVFTIQISNSRCFHIGPKKTVQIHEAQPMKNNMRNSASHCIIGPEVKMSRWLDCEEKLNEDYITLISLHLGKKWKEFGRYLGVDETVLEEHEFRNSTNTILIVYDMLQDYLIRFPETTSGFVISALNEVHHVRLIEQLEREPKTYFPNEFPGLVPF